MILRIINLSAFYYGHVKAGRSIGRCLTLTDISKLLARSALKGGRKGKNIWNKQNWAMARTQNAGNCGIMLFFKETFESQLS